MKKILLVLIAIILLTNVCEAKRNRRKTNTTYKYTYSTPVDNTYEGCGSGWTQDAAYKNCCYSNSGMSVVDVGYAQSKHGMWYCCKRYTR